MQIGLVSRSRRFEVTHKAVEGALKELIDDNRADAARWFFKTGPGEYGEGDEFIGITVPNQRKVAKQYKDLERSELQKLLDSPIHEHRLTGIFILTSQFERGDERAKKSIYTMYLKNVAKGNVNNWDLVDSSAHKIVGSYLLDKPRDVLYELVESESLWEQRVSIIATAWFINNDQFGDTLLISEKLLNHEHDLIHKAVGWMLREVGKRDVPAEQEFLDKHYEQMPRTMLRYAIEKFPESTRQQYLKGTR